MVSDTLPIGKGTKSTEPKPFTTNLMSAQVRGAESDRGWWEDKETERKEGRGDKRGGERERRKGRGEIDYLLLLYTALIEKEKKDRV